MIDVRPDEDALILLYHGTYRRVPGELAGDLHNMPPEALGEQLQYLRQFFQFVSVDELADQSNPAGFAALTFDDAYRSVFEEAWPILRELGIPCTVYLNGANFEGEIFWRDKVRRIQNANKVAEFELTAPQFRIEGKRFYRYTKSPANNSRLVNQALDEFLKREEGAAALSQYCVDSVDEIPEHQNLMLGNHSHRHFVLSSLSESEQSEEILRTEKWLAGFPSGCRSRCFSIPFGGLADFNHATVRSLRRNGYQRVLLSRNRPHPRQGLEVHGIQAFERIMPRSSDKNAGLNILPG